MNSKKYEKITESIKSYEEARKNKLGHPAYPNKLEISLSVHKSQTAKSGLNTLRVHELTELVPQSKWKGCGHISMLLS